MGRVFEHMIRMSPDKIIYKVIKHSSVVGGMVANLHLLLVGMSLFLLVSCGESKGHFKIEGRFLHINGGEMYVYSPDGVIDGMDTVKIQDGRFALEVPCNGDGTLMLVFPNFSQQPIFAESGGAVEVKADASHLKEMEVKGTDANELMTKFRKAVTNMSPPEEQKFAAQFVKDHPESPVCVYLTRRYFVDNSSPDYNQAQTLVRVMMEKQKSNAALVRLKQQIEFAVKTLKGKRLPVFKATDVNGRAVSNADLNAPVAIVTVWATWSFESVDALQAIADAMERSEGKLKVISICVDASKKDCLRTMESHNVDWPVICDGTMLDSKLMRQLGLGTVPDNIILKDGRIDEAGLNASTLRQRLNDMFKTGQ